MRARDVTFTVLALGFAAAIGTGAGTEARQADDRGRRVQPQAPRPVRMDPKPLHGTAAAGALLSADQTALVRQYCTPCHNDRAKIGGLSLAAFDAATASSDPVTTEKVIRKLLARMMPPPGAKRPDDRLLAALTEALEARMDRAAATPHRGERPFPRLNRAEYALAVQQLLGIDVDVSALLPPDTISAGFDTVSDAQTFSPTLLDGYLRAASRIAALAVGDISAAPAEASYRVPKTASQWLRADGAPPGTRGGVSVVHLFPADGEYVFRMDLHGNADGFLYGAPTAGERIEVSIDGVPKALLAIDPRMAEVTTGLTLRTPAIHVRAGAHRVTAAFLQRFEGPVNDLIAPIDHTLADTQIGVAYGITTLPHLKDLVIAGPQRVTGVSDTASRARIFTCRPTTAAEERPCAEQIVRRLARQAFRSTVPEADLDGLMAFYDQGRRQRDFELGVTTALEAILASPDFLFRLERVPESAARPHVSDVELASRLSYFLWASGPDAELVDLARRRRLSLPAVFERQVRRMLADPRAGALSTRFATQWLRLNDVEHVLPDAILYPYYDRTLGEAFVRETQLFFDSLVREDRSLLDLVTADYTFVNERVARHYGIPNVVGEQFRRVRVPDDRRGILGQGSVLVLTSVADRTSPVMRGKWIMEVLLGTPPPPPPPDAPALESTRTVSGGKVMTVVERMAEHRSNPACNSCHRMIDPLGLTLENFDATGKWRIKDAGVPIEATGELYDGTRMEGPAGLRAAIVARQALFIQSFTESLMTYALGRRVEAQDMPTVRGIARRAAAENHRLSAFVLGVATSAPFRSTHSPAAETAGTRKEPAMHIVTGKHLARRTVLRGIGATIALPLLDAMVPVRTRVEAAVPRRPRLVAIEVVHGAAGSTAFGAKQHLWAPAATGSAFDLSPTSLAPLEPYRDWLTIVSNTDVRNAEAFSAAEIGGDHFRSAAVFLTQAHPRQTQGSDVQAGISLDQIVAKLVGAETPLPSMQLCIENIDQAGGCFYGYSCAYTDSISWSTPTTPLPMVRDPRAVFDQLFGVGATPEERALRRQRDRSILDWATRRVATLRAALSASDRARLDEYLEDIREIERRIQRIETFNTSGEPRELPGAPAGVPDSYTEHVRLMFDLQAVAFASDITRVFAFKLSRDVSNRVYPETGVTTGFHIASHHGEREDRIVDLARINKYHVGLLPHFLDKLRNTPDGDASLLEQTLIVYGSSMGNPNVHNHKRCPLLVLGRGAGRLKGNLHVKAPDGTPMANAMLSMLHVLGVESTSFGDSTGAFDLNGDVQQTSAATGPA